MSSVDFPTPGSPPMRMSDPFTIPPPRTRPNSANCNGSRSNSALWISPRRTAPTGYTEGRARGPAFSKVRRLGSLSGALHQDLAFHRQVHALAIDEDRVARPEAPVQEPLRQRVFDQILDGSPHRAGAEGLVE